MARQVEIKVNLMNFFDDFGRRIFDSDWAISFSGFLYELGLAMFFGVLLLVVLFVVVELARKKYPPTAYVVAIIFCANSFI